MAEMFDNYFSTTHIVPIVPSDLGPVGEDVMRHFAMEGYTVSGTRLSSGGWYISMYKGDWFRAILGLKTALNITIDPQPTGTLVQARIGIFELQTLPTVITIFVFAPVILGQIWGIVQQQELDEKAVRFVEDRISFYAGSRVTTPAPDTARAAAEAELGTPGF